MEEIQNYNKNLNSTIKRNQEINPQQLEVNDLVQIDPNLHEGAFDGCVMVVTGVKQWGVVGYVSVPRGRRELPSQAYYRAAWAEVKKVGRAEWIVD